MSAAVGRHASCERQRAGKRCFDRLGIHAVGIRALWERLHGALLSAALDFLAGSLGAAVAAALHSLTGPLAPVFRLGLEHSASLAAAALQAAAAPQDGEGLGFRDGEGEPWAPVAVSALASLQVRLHPRKP